MTEARQTPSSPAEEQSAGQDREEASTDQPEPTVKDDSVTQLPIIALRGTVVFPGVIVPLTLQRPSSLQLLDENLPKSKKIGLVTQRTAETEEPGPDDLYGVGILGQVLKLVRQQEGPTAIVVQGIQRIAVTDYTQTTPYLIAQVQPIHPGKAPEKENQWTAEVNNLRETAGRLIAANPEIPDQARLVLANIEDPGQLADFLAANLPIGVEEKQSLLEELDVVKRVRAVQSAVSRQLEIANLQKKLREDVESEFTDTQRRAYLREQLRAIRRELGEAEGGEEQIENLRARLEEAKLPPEAAEQAERELNRLNVIPPQSPEHSVIVSYLETLAELPWQKLSEDNLDLDAARKILDRDHYDLDKVKRRLIEDLAVRKLNPEGHGAILCFLGPPGVGKTSLGQSIADALGRKFTRMSLGGIRDEAEIRGHRRTYIGSMPGRLIQDIRRVGTRNPVMMLDEVDKIGADFRGDPASALLEVLDPRQNYAFVDRYLDVPFDLSRVLFIATANTIDPIPSALRDRMEVIRLPGYTESEKLRIAEGYLVKRQLEENGLQPQQCQWDQSALEQIIGDYTHEAGVRELERQIGAVCRSVAARVAQNPEHKERITPEIVTEVLGPPQYVRETRLKTSMPGVVTGLAYTPVGGEILHIEAARFPGKGNVILTGQIGDVMKESAQAALSLVRSRADSLGIKSDEFKECDIHVHVPAGAVPKDGPSAGVAMFTAIASLFMNRPVRADIAMTGEITLRGLILPIGGLKEKSLGAMRAGIQTVLVPKLNEKDLPDIPDEVKAKLHFEPVETVDEVLKLALSDR